MKTLAWDVNQASLCLHDVRKRLLVVLMLLYILMNWKSAASGHCLC